MSNTNNSNNTKPNVIQRKKTIILKSSDMDAKKFGTAYTSFTNPKNGDWETIIDTPLEINNGDLLEVQGAYIDTTKINPNTVKLKEAVEITWSNFLYLTNNQDENIAWAKTLNGMQMTDNLPYVFCTYNVKTDSATTPVAGWVDTFEIVSWNKGTTGWQNWGKNFPLTIEYININGDTVRKNVVTDKGGYPHHNPHDNSLGTVQLNVMIQWGTEDRMRNIAPTEDRGGFPFTGWADASTCEDPGGVTFIAIPFQNPHVTAVLDSGVFEPVLHHGNFTISEGEYDPTHLTEIINQNFTEAEKDNIYDKTLPRAGAIYSDPQFVEVVPATVPITYATNIISYSDAFNDGSFKTWYQLSGRNSPTDTKNNFAGWSIQITTSTVDTGSTFTYQTVTETILDNVSGDALHTFRFTNTPTPGSYIFLYGAIYPTKPGAGAKMIITPPSGFDTNVTGACFLQSTENYRQVEADGFPKFCFCSVHEPTLLLPSNVINFTTNLAIPILFGTNQIDLNWDADRRRFRFNYLHFPLTAGGTGAQAPAIRTQTSLASTLSGSTFTYSRALVDGAKNMIATSYGGIGFTKLEPRSFWETLLGMNYGNPGKGQDPSESIIVSFTADNLQSNFGSGIAYSGVTPTAYEDMVTVRANLKAGTNITENLVTIADITGTPLNYQVGLVFPDNTTLDGVNGTLGRVLIGENAVSSINASETGDGVGSLETGYYIIEVQASFSSIESLGDNFAFTKNIRIIMNRYYNMDSYTSMGGDGLEYIHYGMPTRLSSIKCRIFDSNGNPIQDLGQDNTVFLKLTKNLEIQIPQIVNE